MSILVFFCSCKYSFAFLFDIGNKMFILLVFLCEGDCHNDKCVTGAIFNYTSQLMFQFHCELDF